MSHNFQKDMSGCGLAGIINKNGKRISGSSITKSMCLMNDRGNGLGAGYAAYGIYPEYKDLYAFHIMYDEPASQRDTEEYLKKNYHIEKKEPMPTTPVEGITISPMIWRYFVKPLPEKAEREIADLQDDDFVVRTVMKINSEIGGAYFFSSGKNMGAFKGVGMPGEIAKFFKIDEYEGYIWTGHTRFPTNTPGWWGGAHPFTILDWAIVHNGEITSYWTNRAFLEMFGYKCTLLTDTEVVAYALDFLLRQHKLPLRAAFYALASPFWKDIDMDSRDNRELAEALNAIRIQYAPLLLNGPFAILFGWKNGLVGFNDRIKLRPLFAGEKDETLYMASEEATIREICEKPDRLWMPRAGEPVIGMIKEGVENWR